ncbi:O-antigen ligase [Microbulbifer sp. ALW1]|uniref:O-antigen ligase family protein n=1 Tax=Microbulbifer sp. (strain ALW1) TaxID=1516059 RepID=UPI001356D377|nr:O-antigen ligase family protein [Microbulbifer sp. ALW1]
MSKVSSIKIIFFLAGLTIQSFLWDVRAQLLQIVIFGVTYFTAVLWLECKNKVYNLIFIIILFGIPCVVWMYSNIDLVISESQLLGGLDESGRTLKSGRQIIWPILTDLISQKPLLGWGGGALLREFYSDESWSAHNLYLQIMLQTGILGVALLLWLFWKIWQRLIGIEDDSIRAVGCAFFLMIMFHNAFEVILLQNLFSIGILFWIFIGIVLKFNSQLERYNFGVVK